MGTRVNRMLIVSTYIVSGFGGEMSYVGWLNFRNSFHQEVVRQLRHYCDRESSVFAHDYPLDHVVSHSNNILAVYIGDIVVCEDSVLSCVRVLDDGFYLGPLKIEADVPMTFFDACNDFPKWLVSDIKCDLTRICLLQELGGPLSAPPVNTFAIDLNNLISKSESYSIRNATTLHITHKHPSVDSLYRESDLSRTRIFISDHLPYFLFCLGL